MDVKVATETWYFPSRGTMSGHLSACGVGRLKTTSSAVMQCDISLGKRTYSSRQDNKLQKNLYEQDFGLDPRLSQLWISTAWIYVNRTDSDWLSVWELLNLFWCVIIRGRKRENSRVLPLHTLFLTSS